MLRGRGSEEMGKKVLSDKIILFAILRFCFKDITNPRMLILVMMIYIKNAPMLNNGKRLCAGMSSLL